MGLCLKPVSSFICRSIQFYLEHTFLEWNHSKTSARYLGGLVSCQVVLLTLLFLAVANNIIQ